MRDIGGDQPEIGKAGWLIGSADHSGAELVPRLEPAGANTEGGILVADDRIHLGGVAVEERIDVHHPQRIAVVLFHMLIEADEPDRVIVRPRRCGSLFVDAGPLHRDRNGYRWDFPAEGTGG